MTPILVGTPASTADDEPVRTPEEFEHLVREIGAAGACEIRTVFRDDTRARLRRMRELALGPNRARLAREAHSLKGAARTLGYRRLAALALTIESGIDALTEAGYRELIDKIETAHAAALAEERAS